MTTIDLTRPLQELLEERHACADAAAWASQHETAAAAWEACERADWMIWGLDQIGYGDGTLRLFACWCARLTPLADGRTAWDPLTEERSRAAVEVAERYARGEATEQDLAAWDAWDASAAWDAWDASAASDA